MPFDRFPALRLRAPRSARWGIGLALAIFAAVVAFLVIFDWNWFRPMMETVASARLDRRVRIEGDLDVHPWSFTPRAEVHRLRIARPDWQGAGDMVAVERIAVRLKLAPLLRGQQVFELLAIESPDVALVREPSGRANWRFGTGGGGPLKLPAIQHLVIEDGHLTIDDRQRHITFEGAVTSSEHTVGPGKGVFVLEGKGRLNREPFLARVTGDPLLNVSPDRPYPFKATVTSGATRLWADASITHPFDLSRFSGAVTLKGDDLNDLFPLTGLALPNTPPYRLNAKLTRRGTRYDLGGFSGQVGDSDLGGELYVETGGERVYLNGDLRSKRLDFDDLAALFGGRPATGPGETAAPAQRAMPRQRLFPDATLQVERIRAMDADVKYRAATVNAPKLPLRRVRLDLKLKDGVLTADPVSFDLTRGSLAGRVRLDASGKVPRTDVDVRLTNARLEDFITVKFAGAAPIEGAMAARAKLTGYGNSVHKAAASADGQVTLVVPGGTMRQAFAELVGINLTKGLFMLLSEDPKETPIRCAVADFRAKDGVLRASRLVMDTGVVKAEGAGTIDLGRETMDLHLNGDSKKPRLVRLLSPITLKGPLASPKAGVDASAAAGQAGIGVALGALVTPLAAILPFVDLGGAKNENCAALVGAAKAKGAPVKASDG